MLDYCFCLDIANEGYMTKTMIHTKKALEWILKNHHGKIETTPREQHEEPLRTYIEQGFRETIRSECYIRLDKGNDFIIYNIDNHIPIIEYYHNGGKQ
jgi:hypothetical protein